MAHADELEPVRGQEAFHRQDAAALQSQAAFLLLLGQQLRQGEPVTRDGVADEDDEALSVPSLVNMGRPEDLGADAIYFKSGALGFDPRGFPVTNQSDLSKLVETLYEVRTAQAAANVIEACLYVPDALVRVAAAATYVQMVRDDSQSGLTRWWPWPRLFDSLLRGVREEDELVRELAATALDVLWSDSPPPFGETRSKTELNEADQRYGGKPEPTSVIVHGTTFGGGSGWWKPGRVFHRYLKSNVSRNLYGGSKPFSWSGIFSDTARKFGADELLRWVGGKRLDHVFAHSHGGSVAMLASELGLEIEKLILLSCPVHRRYSPDFRYTKKVVSVRTRLDLVVLADGGGQRFRDNRIKEHVLPVWFSHKATRDPGVWKRHAIANKL